MRCKRCTRKDEGETAGGAPSDIVIKVFSSFCLTKCNLKPAAVEITVVCKCSSSDSKSYQKR